MFAAREGESTKQSIQDAYSDYLDTQIHGSRGSYTDDDGKPVDDANGKMVTAFKANIPEGFELSEVTGYTGTTKNRLVKIKKEGGKSLEVDITKSNYAKVIKDFILDNSTTEADVKRMSLTPGVKRRDISTTTVSRRKRKGNNSNSPATPVNSGGVGAGYNGTP